MAQPPADIPYDQQESVFAANVQAFIDSIGPLRRFAAARHDGRFWVYRVIVTVSER
jgi:hypothetical protein